jgi:hypothetical protein
MAAKAFGTAPICPNHYVTQWVTKTKISEEKWHIGKDEKMSPIAWIPK